MMGFNRNVMRRYFNGRFTRKDFVQVKRWFENPAYNDKLKDYLEEHWLEYDVQAELKQDTSPILNRIHSQIGYTETGDSRIRYLQIFQRVASILIIPLILTFLAVIYLQEDNALPNGYAEIFCPLGARTNFILPDGTTGFLNSGSTLKYSIGDFSQRNVLLNGEAYFNVIHHDDKPFEVQTNNLKVIVLGTRFNITAYQDSETENVVLENGKVQITSLAGKNQEILTENQKLVLNIKSQSFTKENVYANQYISWTEGKLTFRNENMKEVVERLSRWYNVDIEIADQEILKYAFRATFTDEPLDEVLKLLTLTAPIQYKIEERVITKDNNYNKRKVTIRLDKRRIDAF